MHTSDVYHTHEPLQKKLEYLFSLRTGSKVNWDSDAYRYLLGVLGNPHLKLPPVIHVAGTNGKGSVVAMLRSMLQASGRKVHVYTSPHLHHVNERIVLAGHEIEDAHLELLIDEIMPYCKQGNLSFFEIMTALALKAFSETPADILILEVGMGGLLDCTNVVENPVVCIINRVSKDHTEFLGDDLPSIAVQKAGIMKRDVPCVVGYQGNAARDVIDVLRFCAQKTDVPLLAYGHEWDVKYRDDGFDFMFSALGQSFAEHFSRPNLIGQHQIWNAGAALAALCVIAKDFPVSLSDMQKGLQSIEWRGRMQKLDPAAYGLPSHIEMWLDCGHNDSAGEILALQAQQWKQQDTKALHIVVGMMGTKKVEEFLRPITEYADTVHAIPIDRESGAHDPEHLAHVLSGLLAQERIYAHKNFVEVMDFFRMNQVRQARILVTGSVYLAGEVLRHNSKSR